MTPKTLSKESGSGFRKQSREALYRLFPALPSYAYDAETDTDILFFPQTATCSILTTGKLAPPAEQFQKWTQSVAALAQLWNAEEILFITESTTPWRFQDNDYPPAARALQFLEDQGIDRQFDGGI